MSFESISRFRGDYAKIVGRSTSELHGGRLGATRPASWQLLRRRCTPHHNIAAAAMIGSTRCQCTTRRSDHDDDSSGEHNFPGVTSQAVSERDRDCMVSDRIDPCVDDTCDDVDCVGDGDVDGDSDGDGDDSDDMWARWEYGNFRTSIQQPSKKVKGNTMLRRHGKGADREQVGRPAGGLNTTGDSKDNRPVGSGPRSPSVQLPSASAAAACTSSPQSRCSELPQLSTTVEDQGLRISEQGRVEAACNAGHAEQLPFPPRYNPRAKTDLLWAALSDDQVEQAVQVLSEHCSAQRLQKLRTVLGQRSDSVRMVFENPSNANNLWAALRTFDSFGLQFVDVVLGEGAEAYRSEWRRGVMHSALGSQKWLSLHEHPSSAACIAHLRGLGYTIYASDLSQRSLSVHDLAWPDLSLYPQDSSDSSTNIRSSSSSSSRCSGDAMSSGTSVSSRPLKVALVMGNEEVGISQEVRDLADELFYIPMKGMQMDR